MSVADILQAMADASSRAALNRGAIIGGTVQQVAQLPEQIAADREHRAQMALATQHTWEQMNLERARAARETELATHQTEADKKAALTESHLNTIIGAGFTKDPATFDLPTAVKQAQALGRADLIPTVATIHEKFQPKVGEAAAGTMGRYLTGPNAGQTIPGSQVPEKPPAPSPAEFAATMNDPTVSVEKRLAAKAALMALQQNPGEQETIRHNQAMEAIGRLTAGREGAAQAETARHNRATELANNPFGGLVTPSATPSVPGQAPTPGITAPTTGAAPSPATTAAGLTGDAFLKQLPSDVAGEVKAYAEGKRPFPTGMSMFRLEPLIKLVSQYDPTFDAANYNARNKARLDLTSPSGTGGKTINSLNTAIQHAGKLSDLIEALDNTDTPAANTVMNWWNKQTGGTKVTNFEAVQPQLMKEVERLWRGAGGSEGDIAALKNSLGPNMGRQQQRESLAQFVSLIEGKLQSTEQQRDNILGPVASAHVPILFDQSKPVLAKITQRAGGATTTTPGMIEATDPQGAIHHAPAGTPLPAGWKLVKP